MANTRAPYVFAAAVIAALLLVALIGYVGPDALVALVGLENTYLVAFVLATIGGVSSLTGVSLIAAIAAFAVGGAHPVLLGLAAGVGIFLSDSAFFALARYGRGLAPESWLRGVEAFSRWARRFPDSVVYAGTYLYLGFTPLPNDVLSVALAAAGYRYWQVALVLLAGDVTLALLVAHLARSGWWLP